MKNKVKPITNTQKSILIGFIILVSILIIITPFLTVQSQTVIVIESRVDMQIVQSELNGLYYVQCIDSCDMWYQTGDIAELYMAFVYPCQAVNFWKMKWHDVYGYAYIPLLPCPAN